MESVVKTYLDRGAAYEPGTFDVSACEASATNAFNGSERVGKSCPAGELATIGTPPSLHEETAEPGTTSPDALRCGPILDDLAIGLSGMRPEKVWLTRESLLVESGHGGVDRTLALDGGEHVSNVLKAGFADDRGAARSRRATAMATAAVTGTAAPASTSMATARSASTPATTMTAPIRVTARTARAVIRAAAAAARQRFVR